MDVKRHGVEPGAPAAVSNCKGRATHCVDDQLDRCSVQRRSAQLCIVTGVCSKVLSQLWAAASMLRVGHCLGGT